MFDAPAGALVEGGARAPARDRANPSVWDALLSDPVCPIDEEARAEAVRDLQRWSRRALLPAVRLFSLAAVWLIVACKRVLPFQFSWHRGIDVLCVWFIRRFVSPEAGWLLMRHFVVETNLLAFLARNSGDPSIPAPTLRPTRLSELGEGAVIEHDVAVYNLVIDLGRSARADVSRPRPLESLDFSALVSPPLDAERRRRRWLSLDIQTALYLMNIPFCLFTTEDEYERAVNSFQLDETICTALANLTGDDAFRAWTPLKFPMWLSIRRDVPRDLFWHAAVCEYAHTHLVRLAERAREVGR